MNAYELYKAIEDNERLNDVKNAFEFKNIVQYADGALDVALDTSTAQIIAQCHENFEAYKDKSQSETDEHHLVRSILEEIEI